MNIVTIGGRSWQKSIGDEGQDVYVALFIEDSEALKGQYPDESHFDIVVDQDADFYMPSTGVEDEGLNEDRIAFKFRKNIFTRFWY